MGRGLNPRKEHCCSLAPHRQHWRPRPCTQRFYPLCFSARPRALKFYSAEAGPKAQVNCRRTLQIVLLGLLGKPATPVSRWFARALLGLALAILAYWVL